MKSVLKIFSIFIYFIHSIKSIDVECSSAYSSSIRSKYDCSGLLIKNEGDSHCCLWDITTSDGINKTYCASIDESQFQDQPSYIIKKTNQYNYKKFILECAEEETIYCSNSLLDQSSENLNCESLKIYDKKDKYCCRWSFKDKSNDDKKMSYCASINHYQYITIKHYVIYKQKYDHYKNLKIDCFGKERNFNIIKYFALMLFIIF